MTHEKSFPASMDRLCKGLSWGISLLFAGVIAMQLAVWSSVPNKAAPALTVLLLAATWLLSYALRPTGYRLTATGLLVCRPWSAVRIPRASIERIEPVTRADLRGSIRLFGVGGLFGYYGRFANRALGSMTWYATRRDGGLLIHLGGGKKILITPDDPGSLLRAWEPAGVPFVL